MYIYIVIYRETVWHNNSSAWLDTRSFKMGSKPGLLYASRIVYGRAIVNLSVSK